MKQIFSNILKSLALYIDVDYLPDYIQTFDRFSKEELMVMLTLILIGLITSKDLDLRGMNFGSEMTNVTILPTKDKRTMNFELILSTTSVPLTTLSIHCFV